MYPYPLHVLLNGSVQVFLLFSSCFRTGSTGSAFAMGYMYIDGPCAFGNRGGNPPKHNQQVPVHTQSQSHYSEKMNYACGPCTVSRPVRLCLPQNLSNSSCDEHYLYVDTYFIDMFYYVF
ncbi:hypothetical protein M434DRAFT_392630 [Hypoxylon sp. CO27-5]|nr:hypothetical protein M434DRAFT_392630 [Hypoxylon sp. CO27-5]